MKKIKPSRYALWSSLRTECSYIVAIAKDGSIIGVCDWNKKEDPESPETLEYRTEKSICDHIRHTIGLQKILKKKRNNPNYKIVENDGGGYDTFEPSDLVNIRG